MRHLKILGLAMAAVLSITAVMASAAQANELTVAGGGSAFITAANDPAVQAEQEFTVDVGKVKCPVLSIPETTVTNKATSISLVPKFGGAAVAEKCKAFGQAVTIDNPCTFIFKLLAALGTVELEIKCPAGENITITESPVTKCDVMVGSQNLGAEHLKLNNVAGNPSDLTLEANITGAVKGIEYEETGTGCKSANQKTTNGKYIGNTTITGFADTAGKEGAALSISIS